MKNDGWYEKGGRTPKPGTIYVNVDVANLDEVASLIESVGKLMKQIEYGDYRDNDENLLVNNSCYIDLMTKMPRE